jgi:hypothetical protein
MRIVKELNYKDCKITVYQWNGKFIIKLEQDNLEQTYKIREYDIAGEQSLNNLLDEEFMSHANRLFEEMKISLKNSMDRNE